MRIYFADRLFMGLPSLLGVISFLCLTTNSALAKSLSKPGCPEKCGNITIPYPFGLGSKCSANSSFIITCQNSTNPPTPFLNSINMRVLNISPFGTVIVNQSVSPISCSEEQMTIYAPVALKGSPFTISAHYNVLAVLGCKNSVWLRANETTVGGCTAICAANSTDTSCNGVNCCRITIPARIQELQYTYQSIRASNRSSCGYVFPVDKKWFEEGDYGGYKGLLLSDPSNPIDRDFGFAPLVLEWEFGTVQQEFSNSVCISPSDYALISVIDYLPNYCSNRLLPFDNRYPDYYCRENRDDYRCKSLLNSYEHEFRNLFYYTMVHDYVSSARYCYCNSGFEGNPYLPEGCSDVDECSDATLNNCPSFAPCRNSYGSFHCFDSGYFNGKVNGITHKIKLAFIVVGIVRGSMLGIFVLLVAAWKSSKVVAKVIKTTRRYMFYKRNGGLLLEQHLSATENGLEKTKLFSSTELAKATDHYNENRVLGRGGQGTVYKGMLVDGRIVAVKKSKKLQEGDIEVFINEVVILSQLNHRNVVKLLGCCLETEVPRLVYEFIPNGTLFQHIHEPSEEFPLTWEMRVRIAREVATALAYLHSAASTPIYHRDIKSTNILLDDKYRAKIADFGTSRLVSIDQTHLTTRIVGTFGYLDPEYFRSSQFTEKSDVYSFGVVMVELLTGEKAISSIRVVEERGLAMHFLHSMEENRLLDILDARVLEEGKKEEIVIIAELARRCLQLNGKARPTMKEVARELEGIQMPKEAYFPENQDDDDGEGIRIDVGDSDGFSSISDSMDFDTIT